MNTLHISLNDPSYFRYAFSRRAVPNLMESLPESKPVNGEFGQYLVSATDTSVFHTKGFSEKYGLPLVLDEQARVIWGSIELRRQRQIEARKVVADFLVNKKLPDYAVNARWCGQETDYQKVATIAATLVPGWFLTMEQGTGKTLSAIARIINLAPGSKVLVICPGSLRTNWLNELRIFMPVEYRAWRVDGDALKRINALVEIGRPDPNVEYRIGIMGFDSLKGSFDALSLTKWDLIIVDESHGAKSHTTKRWKVLKMLRERSKFRLPMTGTPMSGSLNDLWTQLEFCGEGYSGFLTFKGFKNHYGEYAKRFSESSGDWYEQFLAAKDLPGLKETLSLTTFSYSKAEALPDLPEKVYDVIEVEMSPDQAKAYKELKTKVLSEVEESLDKAANIDIAIQNGMVRLLKLSQITSSFLIVPEVAEEGEDGFKKVLVPEHIRHWKPNAKVEATLQLLQVKGRNEKTIVWSCYPQDIEALHRRCEECGIKSVTFYGKVSDKQKDAAVAAYNNDPETKVFIGNQKSGGAGLNLLGYDKERPEDYTTNTTHTIFLAQNFNPVERNQAEDRPHRRGTRVQQRVTDLLIPGTIDQEIREEVTNKRDNSFKLRDVKEILQRVAKNG